ncbi:MAG: hypothetical protein MMC33_009844 [Icmadophila ericetorum]|nr:hypothetical protein [Icmadophila ericetorum]
MNFLKSLIFLCSHLVIINSAYAFPTTPATHLCPVRQVYEFALNTWLENLAVRSNGDILVTELLPAPNLYLIDPFSPKKSPTLVHTFPNALGLLGITEVTPDVFAIISGNFTFTASIPGSYSVSLVDLKNWTDDGNCAPKVTKVINVDAASLLNDIIVLNRDEGLLLSPDSTLGVVFLINIKTGAYQIVLSDPLMKPTSPTAPTGINGMKLIGNTLYFTNSAQRIYASIPIHLSNGTAAGPATIIAHSLTNTSSYDDFIIDKRTGAAYLATQTGNSIARITLQGEQRIIAGNSDSTAIAEPTAVQFGRTSVDRNVLYVTTGGGLGGPINGTVSVGGQLVAIDLDRCGLQMYS